ncbi:putative membrane protein [Stenotrophomonas maltophilia]|uniref:TadG family pilus assembly protein n=1 Tax=Stenotrophomonas chelatiphaga TaxID=517011 RepID=UPI000F4B1BC8|nr:TadG family pilus assembly protein [Stenotrophomonas chelatiphaga]MCS4229552.1 putative membrane protein [Stenotrophomonas chelatiphaga]ROQ45999.1 putative membrane protein [Stenotrophomonas maltophilia]
MQRARTPGFPHPQRGAMSVTMLLVMIGLVAMLGLVEIGYLYWAKRDAQKVADLSAIAGAQRLDLCNASFSDNSAARNNAERQNRFVGVLAIECGSWNTTHPAADHFVAGVSASHPLNAVKVTASRSVLPLFGQNASLPQISAQAVAKRSAPTAVFSVGSQLLRINGNTPLGSTLKLVGVDLDQTTLLGYDGLAQARVTPGGLLQALGIPVDANISIGDFNALLAAHKVSLGRLVDATASVLARSGVAAADLTLLRNALGTRLDLDALTVQLGSDANGSGLFAKIVAPDGSASSALQANVSALDLLTTGITIASDGRGVSINQLNLLGEAVSVRTGVVEPPSIGIGGVGATAYNAQVRVVADVDTNGIRILGLGLGQLLGNLGIRVKLPVHADVTNAMGTLVSLQCTTERPTATIRVDASVLRSCVGKVAEAERFSTRNVCGTSLQNEQMITLLGAAVVNDKLSLDALQASEQVTLAAGETASTRINPLLIGDTVSHIVEELLRVLSNLLSPASNGMSTSQAADNLADQLLKAANPGTSRYNATTTVAFLRRTEPHNGIQPFKEWQLTNGVPHACPLLLGTCFKTGPVWDGFKATVTGEGLGLVDGLLGSLAGGLLINRCDSLLTNLGGDAAYNSCVQKNLSSYLQTAPEGVLDAYLGSGVTAPGNQVSCRGLLCILLKPVLDVLKPVLNGIGTLLTTTLANVLGLELGRTDVHVQSIQCNSAQLVY